jgi:hypothetical protein
MGAVPAATPVIAPVVDTMVAIPVAPLTQVPPAGAEDNEPVDPWQMVSEPVIVEGDAFTVTFFVAEHSPPVVYEITAIPAFIPVTVPVLPTDAFPLMVLHTPPGVPSVRFVVAPSQTTAVPPIAAGLALTVTTTDTVQPDPSE